MKMPSVGSLPAMVPCCWLRRLLLVFFLVSLGPSRAFLLQVSTPTSIKCSHGPCFPRINPRGPLERPFQFLLLSSSAAASELRVANISLTDDTKAPVHAASTVISASNSYSQSEKQYYDADQDEILVANSDSLPVGSREGFAVVHHFTFDPTQDEWDALITNNAEEGAASLPAKDVTRLHLTPDNVTLPVALMMMDPTKFPTISRARKFCRHGRILLHRGPLGVDDSNPEEPIFLPEQVSMGKVGDRVLRGDVIGRQVAVGSGGNAYRYFSARQQKKAPPFDLPVVYEDDHMALVNKPAGVVVYSPKHAGQGLLTVKSALPHVLTPPTKGTLSALKRPKSVHRLDKPTSGILVIGKTLPAMDHLSKQFRDRVVQKTYTAIVNGVPNPNSSGTSKEENESGKEEATMYLDGKNDPPWHWIDSSLEGKHAVTAWRIVQQAPSLRARDSTLTMVQVMPKTGRYHQIRRHFAWVCERPLVGDKEYDGNHPQAVKMRGRGLFLCSNCITLEHPFYNTRAGRQVWDALHDADKQEELWVRETDGKVMLTASIPLPQKFQSELERSGALYNRYASSEASPQP